LYTYNAPQLQTRIEAMQKPERSSLIKLAEDYHNIVCADEACVIYKKAAPLFGMYIEPVGAITKFKEQNNLLSKHTFIGGLIGHIWLPRNNEKLFFRTGVLVTQIEINDHTRTIYKFPLHLEYIYPKGTIRPTASYGVNYYSNNYHTVSVNLGTNVKILPNTFLRSSAEVEMDQVALILPKKYFAYSLYIGILYQI
jgi:hypothetical protein